MVTFVIFFTALLAILFFLISTVLKLILSIFEGGLETLLIGGAIAIAASAVAYGLMGICALIELIRTGSLGSAIFMILIIVFVIGVAVAIFGSIGVAGAGVLLAVLSGVVGVLLVIFEAGYNYSEKAYLYFLNKLAIQIKKC